MSSWSSAAHTADPNVEAEGDVQPDGEFEAESDSEGNTHGDCEAEADEETQAGRARDYVSESAADSRAADSRATDSRATNSPRTTERRAGCAAEGATEEHTDTDFHPPRQPDGEPDRQSHRDCGYAEPQPLAVRSRIGVGRFRGTRHR